MTLSLERLGLAPGVTYRMLDLLSSREQLVSGTVEIALNRAEPKVFKFY